MILRYFEYKIYACLARDEVRQNFLIGSSKLQSSGKVFEVNQVLSSFQSSV